MPRDWLVGRSTRSSGLLAVVLVFAVSRPSAAQNVTPSLADQAAVDSQVAVASLSALSSRVKPGDTVSVRVTSGEDIVGTFSRASASSLTMTVGGQSREIPADDVQQVVRRHGAEPSQAWSADRRANWRPLREQQLLSRGYFFLPTRDGAPAFVRRVGLGRRCYRRWGRSAHRLESLATRAGVLHTAQRTRGKRARCRRHPDFGRCTDPRRCAGSGRLTGRTLVARQAVRDDLRAQGERRRNCGNVLACVGGVADDGSRRADARHSGERRATGVAARREPGEARHVVRFPRWRRCCGHRSFHPVQGQIHRSGPASLLVRLLEAAPA